MYKNPNLTMVVHDCVTDNAYKNVYAAVGSCVRTCEKKYRMNTMKKIICMYLAYFIAVLTFDMLFDIQAVNLWVIPLLVAAFMIIADRITCKVETRAKILDMYNESPDALKRMIEVLSFLQMAREEAFLIDEIHDDHVVIIIDKKNRERVNIHTVVEESGKSNVTDVSIHDTYVKIVLPEKEDTTCTHC